MREPVVMFWDIENTQMTVKTWDLKINGGYIPPDRIVKEKEILCIAYKIRGENNTHVISQGPGIIEADVVEAFREVLEDVDVLVGHNGDKFDLRHLNAKIIDQRLKPLPPIRTVDTWKESKKLAAFPSHRLTYLAKRLYGGKKLDTGGIELWDRCEAGDVDALREMATYCMHDVNVLEEIYEILKPYMTRHPNIATPGTANCPKCNSFGYKLNKRYPTQAGIWRDHVRCLGCGSSYTIRAVGEGMKENKSISVL